VKNTIKIEEFLNNEYYVLVNTRFPHIGEKLRYLYGYPEYYSYIDKLFTDTRGDTRQGFPKEITNALLKLYNYDQNEN